MTLTARSLVWPVRKAPLALSRRQLAWLAAVATTALAVPAWAGSYLDRAALLLDEANKEADYVRGRLADRELARLVHALAAARLKAGSGMQVPKEVVQAHPHLLLVLENYERALSAAADGQPQRFLVYVQRARDEERTFRGVLRQLGWTLPDVD